MPGLEFDDLYNAAARWAGDTSTTGIARAKDAVVFANRDLSYGLQLPKLRPWWRLREDTITPVAGTQTYAIPTGQGTFEDLEEIWFRTSGQRQRIVLVDEETWSEEANEDTTQQGVPAIANLHASSGTSNLRFSPTPSSAFINQLVGGVLRLSGYIEETLTAASGDSAEPLMPDSRRPGIIWKGTEYLAALQGDTTLLAWAAIQGKKFYELILSDDILRTGRAPKIIRPLDPVGNIGQGEIWDYGHRL